MAMSLGSSRGPKAEINLTPMIDVLLVLIIIFMVITPTTSRGLQALVPQTAADTSPPPAGDIVITVHGDRTYQLNNETLDLPGLQARLVSLFRNGADQVVFIRGGKELEFGQIAEVIDMARGAGVFRVGLMTN